MQILMIDSVIAINPKSDGVNNFAKINVVRLPLKRAMKFVPATHTALRNNLSFNEKISNSLFMAIYCQVFIRFCEKVFF